MPYELHPAIEPDHWKGLTDDWLPEVLINLNGSGEYANDNRPPREQRGIYCFFEDGKPLYVGRTSITARTREEGGDPSTSFRTRYDQHTQDATPPGTAPFAWRLTKEALAKKGIDVPEDWWENRKGTASKIYDEYTAQKARIRKMRVKIATFDDDERGVRSHTAEVYAHVQLKTPYNDFSTS